MTTKQQERAEAIEFLSKHCKPGTRVYTSVTHVARSGMSRSIKVFVVDRTKEIMDISGWVGRAIDEPRDHKNGGVKVSGCGMDMGFHIVYNLGRVLFPDGFHCTGANCPSNEHSNKPYPKRDGRMEHHDGGYALRLSWL